MTVAATAFMSTTAPSPDQRSLVGFNFRRAIGEPLTIAVERLILSRVPAQGQLAELQALQLRQQTAYFQALLDPDARNLILREIDHQQQSA